MKNILKIKIICIQLLCFLGAIIIAAAIFSSSLCFSTKTNHVTSLITEINNSKFDDVIDQKNAKILVSVVQILIRDMQLSQLAQKKGRLVDIKELGKVNEKFNTHKLISAINLAKSKCISVPSTTTAESEELFMSLADLSNDTFDKNYCDLMIKNQLLTIEFCKKIILECSDPHLTNWAKQSIPELENQLSFATMCQKNCQ